jgi:hypothetical protein
MTPVVTACMKAIQHYDSIIETCGTRQQLTGYSWAEQSKRVNNNEWPVNYWSNSEYIKNYMSSTTIHDDESMIDDELTTILDTSSSHQALNYSSTTDISDQWLNASGLSSPLKQSSISTDDVLSTATTPSNQQQQQRVKTNNAQRVRNTARSATTTKRNNNSTNALRKSSDTDSSLIQQQNSQQQQQQSKARRNNARPRATSAIRQQAHAEAAALAFTQQQPVDDLTMLQQQQHDTTMQFDTSQRLSSAAVRGRAVRKGVALSNARTQSMLHQQQHELSMQQQQELATAASAFNGELFNHKQQQYQSNHQQATRQLSAAQQLQNHAMRQQQQQQHQQQQSSRQFMQHQQQHHQNNQLMIPSLPQQQQSMPHDPRLSVGASNMLMSEFAMSNGIDDNDLTGLNAIGNLNQQQSMHYDPFDLQMHSEFDMNSMPIGGLPPMDMNVALFDDSHF